MRLLNRYFIFFLILIILFTLVILNPGLLFTYLVDPLTRILWLVVGTVRAIDQEVLWALPVLIAIILGILLLPNQPAHHIRTSYLNKSPIENRVIFWKTQFSSAAGSTTGRVSLQHNLESLSASINELVDGDAGTEIDLSISKSTPWQVVIAWANRLFGRIIPHKNGYQDRVLERKIKQILDSMESRMEISSDRTDRQSKDS